MRRDGRRVHSVSVYTLIKMCLAATTFPAFLRVAYMLLGNQKSLKNDYNFCKIFLDILHNMRYSAGNIWMNLQCGFAAAVFFTERSNLDGSN